SLLVIEVALGVIRPSISRRDGFRHVRAGKHSLASHNFNNRREKLLILSRNLKSQYVLPAHHQAAHCVGETQVQNSPVSSKGFESRPHVLDLTAIRHTLRCQGQPPPYLLLVPRMNVMRLTDIDGHGHAGLL